MAGISKRLQRLIRIKAGKLSDHFQRLDKGQKIFIDGKPFVKVKLRFVDTFDFNTTRYIDQLEKCIESHKTKIETLTETNEHYKRKIEDLQNLNINLVRDTKTKIKEYSNSITDLTNRLKTSDATITELNKTIKESNPLYDFLKQQIVELESKIKTKDIRIRSLEAELEHIKSSRKFNVMTRMEVNKLKRSPDKSLYSIFLKNKEIDEKEKLIKILTNKQKEYIGKIEALKKENDSLRRTDQPQ